MINVATQILNDQEKPRFQRAFSARLKDGFLQLCSATDADDRKKSMPSKGFDIECERITRLAVDFSLWRRIGRTMWPTDSRDDQIQR